MKWGVRRFQNQDGSLTKQGHARYKGIKDKQKLVKTYLNRKMSKRQVTPNNDIDPDIDIVYEKGSTVTHVTPVDFRKLRKGQDLFISADPYDKATYKTFLTLKMKSKGFVDRPISEVAFELNEKLKAPSINKQKTIFNDFYSKNKDVVDSDLSKYYKNKTYNKNDPYNDYIKSLDKTGDSKSLFYKRLKEEGYNAVLDQHDITDTWIQAKKPLIVMDAMNTLGKMKVSEIDNGELTKALNEWIKLNKT